MNQGRYFIPNAMRNQMFYTSPMMRNSFFRQEASGFLGRIGNTFRSFNWRGLFNGAKKTLNFVNQTIPLIRQARPAFENIRSITRLVKSFKSETGSKVNNNFKKNNNIVPKKATTNMVQKKEVLNNNYPNFFI